MWECGSENVVIREIADFLQLHLNISVSANLHITSEPFYIIIVIFCYDQESCRFQA
jgi:hypothetical protein